MGLNEQAMAAMEAVVARKAQADAAQIAMPDLLSGKATWDALLCAVNELKEVAPDDCDVLVQVGDLVVFEARFFEPHTFAFEGLNADHHHTWAVIHFSQLQARIVYYPKRGPERRITGFHPY